MAGLGGKQGDARAAWDAGDDLGAGRMVYEALAANQRPGWAAELLRLACSQILAPKAVQKVLHIAADERRWHEAHEAFQAVRQLTLAQERATGPEAGRTRALLYLAENTAKVAYNASGHPAPFDSDAGWRIGRCLRHVLDVVDDDNFSKLAMSAFLRNPTERSMEKIGKYEVVYTVTDYHDGPRRGVASFGGRPHLYEREWDEQLDEYGEIFRLSPIAEDLLALELEVWEIWLRWKRAFADGTATLETHPALPNDRARYEELQGVLRNRLVIDEKQVIRARANFRPIGPPVPTERGWKPIEAMWTPVDGE